MKKTNTWTHAQENMVTTYLGKTTEFPLVESISFAAEGKMLQKSLVWDLDHTDGRIVSWILM